MHIRIYGPIEINTVFLYLFRVNMNRFEWTAGTVVKTRSSGREVVDKM